jgi:hypothetical protein
MSSAQTWDEMDGTFNYSDFYWRIMTLLDGEEGEQIMETFNL